MPTSDLPADLAAWQWPAAPDTDDPRGRVAIVGGGLAGLEVARHLATLGVDDVLVIEAGPARDLLHINSAHNPDQALRTFLDPADDPHFQRSWTSESAPHYAVNAGLRQRLGGRSLYWYGASLPVEEWALADWPESVVTDLRDSWQGGGPLYEQVAADLGVDPSRLDSQEPVLKVGGFRLVRTPQAETRFGDDGRWYAYSPLDHWRHPVTGAALDGPRGIRFLCDTEVLSADIRDGRACGVHVREPARTPRAAGSPRTRWSWPPEPSRAADWRSSRFVRSTPAARPGWTGSPTTSSRASSCACATRATTGRLVACRMSHPARM